MAEGLIDQPLGIVFDLRGLIDQLLETENVGRGLIV